MAGKISVVVFDLGNVLIPFDYRNIMNKLDKIEKNLGENFLKFYRDNYQYHRSFERGDLSENEFVEIMLSALGRKIDRKTFCEYFSHIFTENKDVIELLPKLKKDYILVMLSNTNSIHYEFGWKQYKFLDYFDKIIVSYKVGAIKPEEKIYKAVESFTKKNPGEHFFIDDVAEYVEGARAVGWEGVQFKGYKHLLMNLLDRGILKYKD